MRTPPEHTQQINSGLYKKYSKTEPKLISILPGIHTKAMWSRGPIMIAFHFDVRQEPLWNPRDHRFFEYLWY
jgi:hypothetical protein